MIVCSCAAVSDREVVQVARRGHDTLGALAACTGAGSACGQCRGDLERLLQRARGDRHEAVPHAGREAEPAAARL